MLEIVVVAAIFLSLWIVAGVVARRANTRYRAVLFLFLGIALTLGLAKGLYELVNSSSLQLFGEIVNGVETSDQLIALTFDDGPSRAFTGPVLETLREKGVTATFFLTGEESARNVDEVRRIIAEGHEIGNHSWSHERMIFKSGAFVEAEVERTDDAIRAAGYTGPIHFRSPYGKKLITLPWYLRQTGRKNIFWDIAPENDSSVAATSEGIVEQVLTHAKPGSIVLLHVMYPVRETSRDALPAMIDGLRARGFRFVTVSELISQRETAGMMDGESVTLADGQVSAGCCPIQKRACKPSS